MDEIPEQTVVLNNDNNEDEGATKNDNIDDIIIEYIIEGEGEDIEVELNNNGRQKR